MVQNTDMAQGTGLFVSIGYGLIEGGPGSLLIAFTIYSCWLGLVNNCMAEMSIYMPVTGGWVRTQVRYLNRACTLTLPTGKNGK